jgi:hypothetical protein
MESSPGQDLVASELVSCGRAYAGSYLTPGTAKQMCDRCFGVVVAGVSPFPDGEPCDVVVAVYVIAHMDGPCAVVGFLRETADRLGRPPPVALLRPQPMPGSSAGRTGARR